MKKKVRKLALAKETVRNLDFQALEQVVGGDLLRMHGHMHRRGGRHCPILSGQLLAAYYHLQVIPPGPMGAASGSMVD